MKRNSNLIGELKIPDFQLGGILYLSASFVFCNDIFPSFVTIFFWLLLLSSLVKKLSGGYEKILLCLLFSSLLIVSSYYNNEDIIGSAKVVFSFFVASLYVQKYRLKTFTDSFIKIMFVVCLISLICLALTYAIPPLNNINVTTNKSGGTVTNWFVFVKAQDSLRNYGLFWEPGAFQFHINIALLFFLFLKQQNKSYFWVFMFALITTYSTTGYLTFVVILASSLLYSNNHVIDRKYLLFICALLLVTGFVFKDLLFGSNLSSGGSTVFGKITNFSTDDDSISSASVRYYGVLLPLKLFWDSPIFGHGIEGLRDLTDTFTNGMNTCTFINWFAQFGLLYGLLAFLGIVGFCRKITRSVFVRIGLFMAFFVASMSENLATNPFLIMIILYGLSKESMAFDRDQSWVNMQHCYK